MVLSNEAEAQKANPRCVETYKSVQARVDALVAERGSLPETYSELTLLPLDLRKEVFRRLAPEVQRQVWQDHLSTYLALDLTSRQRHALQAFLDEVSVDLLQAIQEGRVEKDSAFEMAIKELAEVFPQDLLMDMTVRLGPVSSPEVASADPDQPMCECNRRYHECMSFFWCAPIDCEVVNSGCGFFWQEECDGSCWFAFRPLPG